MIPLYLMLASIGLLAMDNEPKQPSTFSNRRLASQSVYSVHNYKQPHSAALAQQHENQSGMAVGTVAAQPVNYKHQQIIEQPTGTITLNHNPVPTRNYKHP